MIYKKYYVIKKDKLSPIEQAFLEDWIEHHTIKQTTPNTYYVVNQDEWWSFIVKLFIRLFCKRK
jgi:hypothetical protein